MGTSSEGIEAAPMAALASRVKADWSISSDDLLFSAERVLKRSKSVIELEGLRFPVANALCMETRSLYGLRTLDTSQESLLLRGSISPLPLHRALTLLDGISHEPERLQDHLRLSMAWTLVNEAGNLRFGPEVGVTKPKVDVDVASAWYRQIQNMAEDIDQWKSRAGTVAVAHHADARYADQVLEPNSIDAVITSPPYPNEKDYTRTTRLESVLLGLINTKEELRATKKGLVRSNTRSVYVEDDDHSQVVGFPEVTRIAEAIEARRIELGKTSGFERQYHKVTTLYFGGMYRHFANLRPALRPGARLAYVVGDQASYLQVMIRTGKLLAEIAQSLGYEVEAIDLFRTRIATATKEQLREEVVVLRWPG